MNLNYLILLLCLFCVLSCNSSKDTVKAEVPTVKKEPSQREQLASKVIVNIEPDYTAEELAADFAKYELTPKTRTNKTLNAWLFTFNKEKISQKELVKLLNVNDYVQLARGLGNRSGDGLKRSTHKVKANLPTK